jgi:hypothetical protein
MIKIRQCTVRHGVQSVGARYGWKGDLTEVNSIEYRTGRKFENSLLRELSTLPKKWPIQMTALVLRYGKAIKQAKQTISLQIQGTVRYISR